MTACQSVNKRRTFREPDNVFSSTLVADNIFARAYLSTEANLDVKSDVLQRR